jgi:poly-D-alanine transfer protein DltD
MKNFFTMTLASIVGGLLVILLLFFLFMGIGAALGSSGKQEVSVNEHSYVYLDLGAVQIQDHVYDDPFLEFLESLGESSVLSLDRVQSVLKSASSDPNIDGVVVKLGFMGGGYAH